MGSTEPLRGAQQCADRLRPRLENGFVAFLWAGAQQRTQLVRNGERDEKVFNGQQTICLLQQPFLSSLVLTGGAMTIPAGATDPVRIPARLALKDRVPQFARL